MDSGQVKRSDGRRSGVFAQQRTLAEFAKMVVKAKGIEYEAAGSWYDGVVIAAKDSGIIQEGEFDQVRGRNK